MSRATREQLRAYAETVLSLEPKKTLMPVTIGEFAFQCGGCLAIIKRNLWSVAHYDTPHTYTCDCGHVTDVVERGHDDD
jgi:hypothetical protein